VELSTWAKVRTAADLVTAREYGTLRATLERGTFPAALLRRNQLLIERLPVPIIPEPDEGPRGLALRWADPDEIDLLLRVRHRRRAFRASFAAGHRCVVGLLDGEPATVEWVEITGAHVSTANGYSLDLPPASAWILGSFVRPDMRGQRLFARHTRCLAELLMAEGVQQGYCAVEVDNPASRRAHLQAGYEGLYQFHVLRLLGVTRHKAWDLQRPEVPPVIGWGPWSARVEPGPEPVRPPQALAEGA
jgi:hypothetical protein